MYRDRDSGGKELLSMLIYRPISNFIIERFERYIPFTPNQISFISFLTVSLGCLMFISGDRYFALLGVLFLHIGYIFDVMDGQWARYKGLSDAFGKWFDPFLDTIKGGFIFISLGYLAYRARPELSTFIVAMLAMMQSFLAFYVLNTKEQVVEISFSMKLPGKIYIGYEISLYWAISLVVVSGRYFEGLIFLALACLFTWVKAYISLVRNYRSQKAGKK
jgi:phosphatidylglycerophosphate synthase